MNEWVWLGKDDFFFFMIFFIAFLCLPFLPSVSDCKQSVKQRKGQVSVRFPVKIENNDDDMSQRLGTTSSKCFMYISLL